MTRSGLDPEALKAARRAVYDRWSLGSRIVISELVEMAVEAYMNDLVRQLADLSPCEDCEKEGQDASASETP